MIFNCPGARKFKQPEPEIVRCPSCGSETEIWTDEIQAACPKCKHTIMRQPQGASCLDWCKYAKECVGQQVYGNYLKNKSVVLKDTLIKELEDYFGSDLKRINHAKKVLDYAEELLRKEGGDWHIVVPASILHDVGIKAAEEKYGSDAGEYQEKEGPVIAGKILRTLGFKKEDIEEICRIIAHHHSPGAVDTQNFKVLCDADWLVNLKDAVEVKDKSKLKEMIDNVLVTKTAQEMARKIYLSRGG
jgi:DNA-directed RNA polymerase subunit RPC12/RpoP